MMNRMLLSNQNVRHSVNRVIAVFSGGVIAAFFPITLFHQRLTTARQARLNC